MSEINYYHRDRGAILLPPKPELTDEGFLRCYMRIGKVGELRYRNLDGSERIEVVSPEVLFSKDSMDSFKMKPITFHHPPSLVTPKNAMQYQRGMLGHYAIVDGDFLGFVGSVTDETAINALLSGEAREASSGYSAPIRARADGKFDQVQRRGNHSAIVPAGRAGAEVRFHVDGADTECWYQVDSLDLYNADSDTVQEVFKDIQSKQYWDFGDRNDSPEEESDRCDAENCDEEDCPLKTDSEDWHEDRKGQGKPCGKGFISGRKKCSKGKAEQLASDLKAGDAGARARVARGKELATERQKLKKQVEADKGKKATDIPETPKPAQTPAKKPSAASAKAALGNLKKAKAAAKSSTDSDRKTLEANGHSSFEVKSRLSELAKLSSSDPGDKAFRKALLNPIDPNGSTEAALDRTQDQRRIRQKSTISDDDALEAGANLRQGMRGTAGGDNNRAQLEYSAQIYDRLTDKQKNTFAAEAGKTIYSDPLYKIPRYKSLVNDIKARYEKINKTDADEGEQSERTDAVQTMATIAFPSGRVFDIEDEDLANSILGLIEDLNDDEEEDEMQPWKTLGYDSADEAIEDLKSKLDSTEGKLAGIEAQVTELKTKLDAAESERMDADQIASHVSARADAWGLVLPFLRLDSPDYQPDYKLDVAEIQKLAIAKKLPDLKLDGKSPEFIEGIWATIEPQLKQDQGTRQDSTLSFKDTIEALQRQDGAMTQPSAMTAKRKGRALPGTMQMDKKPCQ